MNEVTFENDWGDTVTGYYYPNDTETGVVIAHGFLSGKDDERFLQLASELHKDGFNVILPALAGGDDVPISVTGEVSDVQASIKYLRSKGVTTVGTVGHSLGGLVSLRCHDSVDAITGWAPVVKPIPERMEQYMDAFDRVEEGFTAEVGGEEFLIASTFFREIQAIDTKSLLAPVKIPTLVIHGEGDDTVPKEHVLEALSLLDNGELHLVDDGHNFDQSLNTVIAKTKGWLQDSL